MKARRPTKKPIPTQTTRRNFLKILTASLAVIFLALIFSWLYDFFAIADRFKAIGYTPTAEIVSLREDIALTTKAELIFAASRPNIEDRDAFNTSCASSNHEIAVLGCYADGRIYLYAIDNSELAGIKQSTLAHELLHAAWARLSIFEQDQLASELELFYETNTATLKSRLELYPNQKFYDELHSIVGTEYADLSTELETHYAKFFTDQNRIVGFYDQYDAKFQELKDRANQLQDQISINQELIDAQTTNYNDALAELNLAISEFNRRADSGYFANYGAFQAERSVLMTKQQELENLFSKIDLLIEATNVLIYEYNNNLSRSEALINSINSNAEQPIPIED